MDVGTFLAELRVPPDKDPTSSPPVGSGTHRNSRKILFLTRNTCHPPTSKLSVKRACDASRGWCALGTRTFS